MDRDGVINHDSDAYIKTIDEWIPIEGSLEAIAELKQAGYIVAIATNQSGIGRGYYSEGVLDEMHAKMQALLSSQYGVQVDYIAYCPHRPEDGCDCRKPKAGLLDQIEQVLSVSLENVWMVGDSLRDLQAGALKNMQPVLVRTGKGVKTQNDVKLPENTFVYDTLFDAVRDLLAP